MMSSPKWDLRYLRLARTVAGWSKDPSMGCGCFMVDLNNRPVSFGFNGFPQRVADRPELLENRVLKYERIIHAEMNALIFAGRSLHGIKCYTWPIPPCIHCAAMLVQANIDFFIWPHYTPKHLETLTSNPARWIEEGGKTYEFLKAARCTIVQYPGGQLDAVEE